MIATATTRADLAWLVDRTQCNITSEMRGIKAVDRAGKIRGMVGYDSWTENSVQAHMAVDTPVAWRALLPAVFVYPFLECKKGVLLGVIPSHNTASWGMAKHLGFEVKYAVRDGWARGDDLLLLELRREKCRYLQGSL